MKYQFSLWWMVLSLAISPLLYAQNTNDRKIVRVVYLVPADREPKELYRKSIEKAIKEVRNWYYTTTGMTFTLSKPVVEIKRSEKPADWFDNTPDQVWNGEYRHLWFTGNTRTEMKSIYGDVYNDPRYNWVVYVDAKGQTGTGGGGRATLPEHDVLGVSGLSTDQPYIGRWYGGLAHEVGHAFGLVHAVTDQSNALMMYGYTLYPKSTLTLQDLFILDNSPFMNVRNARKKAFSAKYHHEGGWFLKQGTIWTETDKNGLPNYTFQEISQDKTLYVIEDRSRNMQLRIPVSGGTSFWRTGGQWNPLYTLTLR